MRLRASGGQFFGQTTWDPWLIIAQIVFLQCAFYGYAVVFLVAFSLTFEGELHISDVLDYTKTDWAIAAGWVPICAFAAASIPMAITLSSTVQRVKKCLDFGATIYFFHFLFCSIHTAVPTSIPWWVVNGVCLAIVVMLAEFLCMRRESQTINLIDRDRATADSQLRRQSTIQHNAGGASAVVIRGGSTSHSNNNGNVRRKKKEDSVINERADAGETDSLLAVADSTRERGPHRPPSRGAIGRSLSPSLSPLLGASSTDSASGQRRSKINVITV